MSTTPETSRPRASADDTQKLARIRAILDEQGETPGLALTAIAEIVGRRETSGATYQKPLG